MQPERLTYTTEDFYTKFNYSGKNYFKDFGKNEKARRVDKNLFVLIIKTYLKIYFYELFLLNKPIYFFVGGLLKLCRIGGKVVEKNNVLEHWKHSVGLFWYYRPSQRFLFSMKLKKQKGKRNSLPKLEKIWREENEITDLTLSIILKEEHFTNFTYFQ